MDYHGHWDIESRISDLASTLSYEIEGERVERDREISFLFSRVRELEDRISNLERNRSET